MSFEGQARDLQDLRHRLERTKRQRWLTVDDRQALLTTMKTHKTQLAEAERTLNLPAPPGAAHTRGQLIVWTEMARGTLTSLEEDGR